jgi:hypothetical protein
MDDRSPMTFDQAQQSLANPETLAAAIEALRETIGPETPISEWDDVDRLAFAGIVVRHAEFGVVVPPEWLDQAIEWLESEAIEWDEATARRIRRQKEIASLKDKRARL